STNTPTPAVYAPTLPAALPILSFSGLTDTGHADTTPITKDGTFDLSLSGDLDANGIDTVVYQVSLNGGAWTTTTANQSDLADGSYQFRTLLTDNACHSSNTASS